MLVLIMAFLANLIVSGTDQAGWACLSRLFVSLLVGYGLAISHGQWMFGPPWCNSC